jgi:hypothetical protein
VRVNLLADPNNPPEQYVPPTDLPAVPEIPPCVSPLSSGGVRFESPGTGGSGPIVAGSTLPATGGDVAPVVVLILVATAGFALLARRSVRT